MDDLQVKQLILKYLDGQCTEEETALVESWYLKQSTAFQRPAAEMIDRNEELMWNFLENRMAEKKRVRLWPRIAIASAIAFVVIGTYFFRSSFTATNNNNTAYVTTAINPGKNGATLTLANGTKILINDALAGDIANQSGVKISKTKDGQIIYEITEQSSGKLEYNTLSTTRGEQTQVRLPDGSLVFLNAASSLKYPTSFAKSSERRVSLTGEGYFEIAKDKMHPFVVVTGQQEVEVLGTHFNINSYTNEPVIKTTLLEGSVRVTQGASEKVLTPGTEALNSGNGILVKKTNTELAIAWKNKQFMFESENIRTIMRMVERWYNVDVFYSDNIPADTFSGGFSRYDNISELLNTLTSTGKVKFRIEGNSVFVSR